TCRTRSPSRSAASPCRKTLLATCPITTSRSRSAELIAKIPSPIHVPNSSRRGHSYFAKRGHSHVALTHVAYLKRLVERVRPELIILCGAGEALPILRAAISLNINKTAPPITGRWGRADAELYRLSEASWESGRIKLMALAHLSRLGPRREFREQILPAIRRDRI